MIHVQGMYLLMAKPSFSRTMGMPMTFTGKSSSCAIVLSTRNCWKSFLPNRATSGSTILKSLATTCDTLQMLCPYFMQDMGCHSVKRPVSESMYLRTADDAGKGGKGRTVATPRKKCGRDCPHRGCCSSSTWTNV